ncbi:hypothetical protein EGR_09053 [Echinococcus granulosus]|uniref:Uncharacterized protein n=1 Tax=Echinococcus granulosus TaxID=6210 RepID=W6U4K1_ECHGR|nr:hypothetical protein EGR_09053 [Echinococcus granulosus]EUB56063.1 hypothetical protein EGR_09053 [Echinococcus granulosus]
MGMTGLARFPKTISPIWCRWAGRLDISDQYGNRNFSDSNLQQAGTSLASWNVHWHIHCGGGEDDRRMSQFREIDWKWESAQQSNNPPQNFMTITA